MKQWGITLSENALRVLESRYLKKDDSGKVIETPEELFERVAKAIAEVEHEYGATKEEIEDLTEKFFSLMASGKFLPNSPTLMNAGTPMGQLSACFVLPVEDSMEGIFGTLKEAAIIHKTGGGTGFSFSRLRPKGDIVRTTGGVASGPVSFMKVFNAATEAVKQGGRRRGANMGILRIDHPDILEFITCKDDVGEITNFNISVAVTDDFMEKLKKGEDYTLVNPRTGKPVRTISTREVFDKIVYQAWKNGEPGLIFIDRINKTHTLKGVGEIEATNPCGEKPLLPYESCNLGSINVALFFKGKPWYLEENRPSTFDEVKDRIDWKELKKVTELAVHFLDNVVDANKYPLPEIERITLMNRKIGLGVMGFADLLYQLGIPYSSEEALKAARAIMKFIQDVAHKKSIKIGKKKGPFPNIEKSIFKGTTRRNAVVTTIAPTGTISMIADTSPGIEPNFSLVYVKRVMEGQELLYVNKHLKEAAEELGFWSEELFDRLSRSRSLKRFEEIPEHIRQIFDTTFDIEPEQHVKIQAAFQEYVEDAVSKTINLPNSAKPEDIERAFLLAYELGCKGITVYRDGSRPSQVMSVKEKERQVPGSRIPRSRPTITKGRTYKMLTDLGSLYITVNDDEQGPFEVFVHLGKSGSSSMAFTEAIGRLISLALRSGVSPKAIIKQLYGIKSSTPVRQEDGQVVFSVPDAIAKVLEKHISGGEQLSLSGMKPSLSFFFPSREKENGHSLSEETLRMVDLCPECGGSLEFLEGCYICRDCGYSKCE
jgi:ribonucleoside-diphosphate reductase alpha chain